MIAGSDRICTDTFKINPKVNTMNNGIDGVNIYTIKKNVIVHYTSRV